MDDTPQHWTRDEYTVSTDRAALDVDAAYALVRSTPWATTLQRDVFARSLVDSLVFAMSRGDTMVGFARVVTDRTTYGYVTDVVVDASLRGQGLGQWMMECLLAHPDLQGLRRISLLTVEAQTLYERCGFVAGPPDDCHVYMERRTPPPLK
jgi:ribosomal protein S18 acetylase RimI-like enzyme